MNKLPKSLILRREEIEAVFILKLFHSPFLHRVSILSQPQSRTPPLLTPSLLHKKTSSLFPSPMASPIHDHGDPLPGTEGSHILQLFICDPHGNQQLLGVTGTQSEKRPDAVTELDLRQVITRSPGWLCGKRDREPSSPQSLGGCAHALYSHMEGLGLERCFGLPTPAFSLVVVVDVGDSPDVLQVKAHPCELSLLPTSYVFSCNTAPMPVSIRGHHVQGWGYDKNQARNLTMKTAWPHLADTGGCAGPPQSAPGTRHGRQRQRDPQAWQVSLWPGLAVTATLGTA